jgi:hypothetical protein
VILHRHRIITLGIAAAVALAGTLAACHYSALGLTLAHYDARAHLVVARRILDSLTPGWQQIGAVWLPLPHLLNMIPVQVDAWYRSGASAVAISILAMAFGAGSLASIVLRTTGSAVAACTGAVLLMINPNVLYLQSTPMTEPLLFGLTLFSIAATAAWVDGGVPAEAGSHALRGGVPPSRGRNTALPGMALTAACLTRYEAWPIAASILALALAVMLRRGEPWRRAVEDVARLAVWPAIAIAVFSANSRWVIGSWFVPNDFFVPENTEALQRPLVAWRQVREGLYELAGTALPRAGFVGAALVAWGAVRSRERAPLLLILALFAAAALPIAAYMQGHPFRIRYDAPLVIASAATAAAGIAVLWRPLRPILAIVLVLVTIRQAPPLDREAPLVQESQREADNMIGRRAITTYLQHHYDGTGIMMSMGSLGHYMHDLSLSGFEIKDFLHEGNGEIWRFAMLGPRGHAGWLIIEGSAEGGDALHHASLRDRWLEGFEKVAEGGGAKLYRDSGFGARGSKIPNRSLPRIPEPRVPSRVSSPKP